MKEDAFLSHNTGNVFWFNHWRPLYFSVRMGIVLETLGRHHQLECAVVGVSNIDNSILAVGVPSKIAQERV